MERCDILGLEMDVGWSSCLLESRGNTSVHKYTNKQIHKLHRTSCSKIQITLVFTFLIPE